MRVLRKSFIIVLLTVGFAAGCATAGSSPPATGGGVSPGQFVWRDLVSTDVGAARRFYTSLLGWEYEEAERAGRPYLIVRDAVGAFAGLVDISGQADAASHWVSYVSVADVDKAATAVQSAGGKILVAPTAVASSGRAAVVADPQGAPLGLARLAGGDPTDPAQPRAGRFFWAEYLAADSSKALTFYKELLGYESKSTDTGLGLEYFVLSGDRPRAGLFQIPADVKQVRPNWLPYVLVDDPAALAARVAGLGGRVLLEPAPERRKGTLAIVADPSGGVLALQKYPI